MHELLEVSAQIGGMHSDNPIINFTYKLIKKRKLKEICKKIDKLPYPSSKDIIGFTALYITSAGMDVDGDVSYLNTEEIYATINTLYSGVQYIIYPAKPERASYDEYTVTIHEGSIEYGGIRHNPSCDRYAKTYPEYVNKYLMAIIKVGMKQLCTKAILGGN